MALHNKENVVEVGEFLNREDALTLVALLRKELRVGTFSSTVRRTL